MSKFLKSIVYVLLFFSVVVLLFFKTDWMGHMIYPIYYKEDIKINAENYDVDPILVAAIIKVESNYKPNKVSVKNAIGLMQIMPDTANWLLQLYDLDPYNEQALMQEDVNIKVGTLYLSVLMKQFEVQLENLPSEHKIAFLAAAYNAGPGSLSNWINQGIWDGNPDEITRIPYGETRHYVRRILYYYEKYQQFYKDFFQS